MSMGKAIRLTAIILLIIYCSALSGCVNHNPPKVNNSVIQSASEFHHSFDIKKFHTIDPAGLVKKVNNFMIIFDPSASMTELYKTSQNCASCHVKFRDKTYSEKHAVKYGGKKFLAKSTRNFYMQCGLCHKNFTFTKFNFAKELTMAFNKEIPNLDITGTLRTFGSPAYTMMDYGHKRNDNTKYKKYNKREYGDAIDKILDAEGVSPLNFALEAAGVDLFNQKGRTAIIIISDGKGMGKREVLAAKDLKYLYGENNICLYTVLIGHDPIGKKVLNQIANIGKCGLAVNGDDLLKPSEMDNFVKKIFLTKPLPDSDGDGVPDYMDDCPHTEPGLRVDKHGCWRLIVLNNVLFDFDKYTLKPKGKKILDKVVALLKKYPFLDLHISGHTDNFGSMQYNIKLSKERTEAGAHYIEKHGIDPDRLFLSWHSYTMPVASNSTPAGRALNRRLEFKFTKRYTQ